ncbi:MAG: outer membrane lipid asymmetry maintenance protein MlaD [Desulfuromonadales bacterium]|jgi:phospholipid/cholesterol/gamma-HCH transport system substrate-binding protein
MKRFNTEIIVGIFMVVAFVGFAWMAVRLGDIDFFREARYPLSANFSSVGGLKPGASVEVAGVQIGTVNEITLDQEYYEAVVHMNIDSGVKIQEDSIASIRTTGIIGQKYVNISPGGAPESLKPGDRIIETESAISLEELVSKYIFEGK